MAHSVEGHLKVRVEDYDTEIRRLVPAYDPMRQVQLNVLALVLGKSGGRVLDLGGGTGALAAAVAARFPAVKVEIWDTDPAMLALAQEPSATRGAGSGARARA
jgi:ubiquinone/menaquinone biosynthesis C-methylase UbiE